MKTPRMLLCAALTVAAAATAVKAHHSFSMFDNAREEVIVGDVVRWGFNSPHTLMYIKDAKGTRGASRGPHHPRSWRAVRKSMGSLSSLATASP